MMKAGLKTTTVDVEYLMSFVYAAERQRPYLMTRVQGTNDYVNAAFLDVSVDCCVWLHSVLLLQCNVHLLYRS